jgi:hypothetical protein
MRAHKVNTQFAHYRLPPDTVVCLHTFNMLLMNIMFPCHRFTPITAKKVASSHTRTDRLAFNEAFSDLVKDFGESMPHQTACHPADYHLDNQSAKRHRPLTFLHCGLFHNKAAVFAEMKRLGILPASCSDGNLRHWWRSDFWEVKIKGWQPFAKCEACIQYRASLLSCRTLASRDLVRAQQLSHRQQISVGRRRYDIREKLSEALPQEFLHVSIDAMDNKKTNIPQTRHLTHTKKVAQAGELLKTRIMGKLLQMY